MTDRVSKIILRGDISDLQAKMVAAGKSVGAFGDKVTAQDKKSQAFRRGLTEVGDAAGKMGLVAAAGLGAIVAVTANFDKQMSAVQAATHESADAMEALRQAAIKAGADTAFSASEAAQGIENLAKAGVTTGDILGGGLQGALDLAAAGTIEVGAAAETAATAMSQFGLAGKDVPHIADLLAAAAGKAQGEVSDMSQALNQVGLVANQTGLSIEETTGGLAAFAHAGLLGSDAGTSFKTMLLSLVPKSEEAGKLMDSLGFSAFDANGNFVGLADTAQRLRDSLAGMTAEQRQSTLQTIFGTDAIRAANVLYTQGADGIDKWIGKVNDQGYAAETAAIKLDNLSGDLEAFKGSLETALIGSGENSQGILRGFVQGATDATNAFNDLSPQIKNTGTAMLAVTAILGGGLWFSSKAVAGVTAMRNAMVSLGLASETTALSLGTVAAGAGIVAGITFTGIGTLEMMDSAKRSREAADATADSFEELKSTLQDSNVGKYAGDLGIDVDKLATDLFQFGDKGKYASEVIKQLDDTGHGLGPMFKAIGGTIIPGYTNATEKASDANGDLYDILENNKDQLGQGAQALDDAKSPTDALTGATDDLTGATAESTDALAANTKEIEDNVKAMQDRYDANVSAFDAETAFQRALNEGKDRNADKKKLQEQIADLRKGGVKDSEKSRLADLEAQLKEYANTLDKSTVAGQKNRDILSDMAQAWNGLSDKQKNAKGAYTDARQALIDQAVQFGATRREARRYADNLLQIPPKVTTKLTLDKQQAEQALKDIKTRYDAIKPKTVTITFKTFRDAALADANRANFAPPPGSSPTRHADGGYISGPGTATSDSIPAYLSNGEYVIRAAAVDRYGVNFLHELNRMRFAQGGYVDQRAQRAQARGYAAGGYVTGGGVSIDYERLTRAMLAARPLYGDVHNMPHDYNEFKRQQRADLAAASGGGVEF